MALDIPFLGEPLARGRPVIRKAALALEPVTALSRLAERIHALSERALQPNPFLLPEFLGPAIEAMGPSSLRLATLTDRNDIRFFAPVLVRATRLTVWTSPYFPLGAPLIEAETCEQVVETLLEQMRANGRRLLIMPNLPLLGPAAECIRSVAERNGSTLTAERQARPILHGGGGVAAFDGMVPAKRRRDLERQLRKLGEAGGVSHVTATSPSDVDAAFGLVPRARGVRLEGTARHGAAACAAPRADSPPTRSPALPARVPSGSTRCASARSPPPC